MLIFYSSILDEVAISNTLHLISDISFKASMLSGNSLGVTIENRNIILVFN